MNGETFAGLFVIVICTRVIGYIQIYEFINSIDDMKLAEALAQRADLQKRIAQMDGRLKAACKVQEGDEPAERPEALFEEFNRCIDELEQLIRKSTARTRVSCLPTARRLPIRLRCAMC